MKSSSNHSRNGFSLIELSVVLVIIAIIMGSIFTIAIRTTGASRIKQTEAKLDTIEESLAAYLAVNRRLPCPADGSLALDDVNFGQENGVAGTCAGNQISGKVHAGVLPIRVLQLPDAYIEDGWGKRFTYAVFNDFTIDTGVPATFTSTAWNAGNFITVGIAENGNEHTTNAVYVLISHGEDGHGAWLKNGGSQFDAGTADAEEFENSHIGGGGPFDTEYVQKNRSQTFDDIVRYRLKYQIVRAAGAITQEPVCNDVDTVVSETSNTVCSNNATYADCESILDRLVATVSNLCLQ